MPKKQPSFEDKLNALESLIEHMESGELELDEALKHFEQGVKLAKECQESLSKAEQRVSILLDNDENGELTSFDTTDAEDEL